MKTDIKTILFRLVFVAYLVFCVFLAVKLLPKVSKVASGEVVVTFDLNKGFSPSEVVISRGTTVRFRNMSGVNFWPASDFYPQNSNYSDFDPKRIIESGGEWSFRFDNTGSWGYHDHIKPIFKGVVVVTDKKMFHIQNKSTCGDLSKLSYVQRQLCWYNQIKEAVKTGGVEKALVLFESLYNSEPLFSQGCHDAMHLIGDEAYREYRKGVKFDFSEETSFCGYGFYHGFIEAMLYTTADYKEVTDFCEEANTNIKNIESPNAIYSCYHGIGHSTFDAHDPSLWGDENKMVGPAITTCERVTKNYSQEKTKQCVTGVFNALGIAYANNLYKFKLKESDPVWYCRNLNDTYKKACFIEVSMAWINSQMGDYDFKFNDGAKFIQNLNDAVGEEAAIFALSSEFSRLHLNDFSDKSLLDNCRSVRKDLFDQCLVGVQLALLNWGKPGEEYVRALSFCDNGVFSVNEKRSCYGYIFKHLPNMYSKEKRISICEGLLDQGIKSQCINSQ